METGRGDHIGWSRGRGSACLWECYIDFCEEGGDFFQVGLLGCGKMVGSGEELRLGNGGTVE
jgi:hypothetical protein